MPAHDEHIPLTDEERAAAARAAALIAAAMAHPEAQASQALRESLHRPVRGTRASARRRRVPLAAGIGFIVALVAAVVVLRAPRHAGGAAPSIQQVRVVARLGPRASPPAVQHAGTHPPRLSLAVQGLSFPDWDQAFGWRASGRRQDRVGDRAVTTVYYRYRDRTTIAYAIVAGSPLASPAARAIVRARRRYSVTADAARTTVTWIQAGHTCLLDAPSTVSGRELVALAAWPGD